MVLRLSPSSGEESILIGQQWGQTRGVPEEDPGTLELSGCSGISHREAPRFGGCRWAHFRLEWLF